MYYTVYDFVQIYLKDKCHEWRLKMRENLTK